MALEVAAFSRHGSLGIMRTPRLHGAASCGVGLSVSPSPVEGHFLPKAVGRAAVNPDACSLGMGPSLGKGSADVMRDLEMGASCIVQEATPRDALQTGEEKYTGEARGWEPEGGGTQPRAGDAGDARGHRELKRQEACSLGCAGLLTPWLQAAGCRAGRGGRGSSRPQPLVLCHGSPAQPPREARAPKAAAPLPLLCEADFWEGKARPSGGCRGHHPGPPALGSSWWGCSRNFRPQSPLAGLRLPVGGAARPSLGAQVDVVLGTKSIFWADFFRSVQEAGVQLWDPS